MKPATYTDACYEGNHDMCTTYVSMHVGGWCTCPCHAEQRPADEAERIEYEQIHQADEQPRCRWSRDGQCEMSGNPVAAAIKGIEQEGDWCAGQVDTDWCYLDTK